MVLIRINSTFFAHTVLRGWKILKSFIYVLSAMLGGWLGYRIANSQHAWFQEFFYWTQATITNGSLKYMLIGTMLFCILTWSGQKWLVRNFHSMISHMRHFTLYETILMMTAIIGSLFVSQLLISTFMVESVALTRGLHLAFAFISAHYTYRKRVEIALNLQKFFQNRFPANLPKQQDAQVDVKILDTSVIIDGRIADLCQTGFIEGRFLIPEFVLEELQHIADSADLLKRNRGRRGLDILNKMQKELNIPISIYEGRFEETLEVDSKLIKLAKLLRAKVITNDFNLNKVCELQAVQVLNINDLANAIKPVVLPGEEMNVSIVKDGKENGQGVAYLDDGTMIVVEAGKEFMGTHLSVIVTSVLQTSAGRMIFARPKWLEKAL
jgi:uncharacterized protein YacL